MQGLLQLAQLPFVGCGCTASAITMDKAITNAMTDVAGIAQAKWLPLTRDGYQKDAAALRQKAIGRLGFPIFVKPANAGSSVGVGKARNETELADAIEKAFLHDDKLVLEEGIDGMEVECAVLGNEKPKASTVGEVVPCNDFYDYEAKYIAADSELHIPARLPADTLEAVRAAACRVFTEMGCSGLARVDFFVRKSDGAVLLNEPNTILLYAHQHVSQALGTHRPALWRAARPADPARFKKMGAEGLTRRIPTFAKGCLPFWKKTLS